LRSDGCDRYVLRRITGKLVLKKVKTRAQPDGFQPNGLFPAQRSSMSVSLNATRWKGPLLAKRTFGVNRKAGMGLL